MLMASLISSSTSFCSTSTITRSAPYQPSFSSIPYHKTPKFGLFSWIFHLDIGNSSQWSGLKHLGMSITPRFLKKERKVRYTGRVVRASLFGVGAPEALVIGAVALLVFGPKGLAEVARNLGKTLRAFQPTIRELQEVSREFKSSLEREIGLDEILSQRQNTYSNGANTASTPSSVGKTENSPTAAGPNGASSQTRAYSSEDYLKITEEQLKAAAVQQQGQTSLPKQSQSETQSELQATDEKAAGAMPPVQKPQNEV